MPAKVDADDRRRQLVLAATELIADEGINALTNAKIAKRLSGSTTMVTHYFRSKRELVLDTYQTMARLITAPAGEPGPCARSARTTRSSRTRPPPPPRSRGSGAAAPGTRPRPRRPG